jgi:Glycosyltransferase family 87
MKNPLPTLRPTRRVLVVLVALEMIAVWWLLCTLTWHIDAVTYLAAGERLNAGHQLYTLIPGDRTPSVEFSGLGTPLLYPPFIAVLWRPLAALPFMLGLYMWMAATVVAIFGAIWYVARDLRTTALIALILLSAGIGSELSGGNVNSFVILGALLLWSQAERRPWVGALMGVLTAAKLSPGIFIVWLISQRRWKALAWAIAGLSGGLVLGVLVAGWDANMQAIDILRRSTPQNLTVTGITGISWATAAVDVIGVAAVLLLTRKPAASFRAAALTIIFGAPHLSLSNAAYGLLLMPPRKNASTATPAEGTNPAPEDAVSGPPQSLEVAPASAAAATAPDVAG